MTQELDILNGKFALRLPTLIEASAGTGKTFSIQHYFTRLLLEEEDGLPPLDIGEIVVITFTNKAAKELRKRILETLKEAKRHLEEGISTWGYIKTLLDQGEVERKRGRRALQRALFLFEECTISTIHAFAGKMVEESGSSLILEPPHSKQSLHRFLYHSFSSPLPLFSSQIRLLFSHFAPTDKLERQLVDLLLKKQEILLPQSSFALGKTILTSLKEHPTTSVSDLDQLYTKESSSLEQIALLDKLLQQPEEITLLDELLAFPPFYTNDKRKKRPPPTKIDPTFLHCLERKISPLIERLRSKEQIFAETAHFLRKRYLSLPKEEQLATCDDLLEEALSLINDPIKVNKLRGRFKAAIIDEFQDTDPTQWRIIEELFLKGEERFALLVGDPKQAIYAFRQADVYSYLQAKGRIARDRYFSLETSYRSTPALLRSLNHLLAEKELIELPKNNLKLLCPKLKAGVQGEETTPSSKTTTIFYHSAPRFSQRIVEELFYPFIIAEILTLHEKGEPLSSIALLVKDHHQQEALAALLRERSIPFNLQKELSIGLKELLEDCYLLFETIYAPSEKAVKRLFATRWMEWKCESLLERWEELLQELHRLREIFINHSLYYSMQQLLSSALGERAGETLMEHLLSSSKGDEKLFFLQVVIEKAIGELVQPTLEELLRWLSSLPQRELHADEKLLYRPIKKREGVEIMTLHISKGLEFSTVFAIGLCQRPSQLFNLVPERDDRTKLTSLKKEEADYHAKEEAAERVRLAYVAMTRAKERLYLPLLFDKRSPPTIHQASPVELWLAHFIKEREDSLENGLERLKEGPSLLHTHLDPQLIRLVELSSTKIGSLPETTIEPENLNDSSHATRKPPHFVDKSWKRELFSFSRLKGNLFFPRERLQPSTSTLPGGREMGILLHKILESIDFTQPREKLRLLCERYLSATPLLNHLDELLTLLQAVLQTPFPLKESFSLQQIARKDTLREVSFFQGRDDRKCYFKGTIDLLFRHRNIYYFLDWKSHQLADYSQNSLKQIILEERYDLQASIYHSAVQSYLTSLGLNPNLCYGGGFLFFLRGAPSQEAILHFAQEELELKNPLPKQVTRLDEVEYTPIKTM